MSISLINKTLSIFLAFLFFQLQSMQLLPFKDAVLSNQDLVKRHILPHIPIASLPLFKGTCKTFDSWTKKTEEIVTFRLKQDYVLFWDFFYPSFDQAENKKRIEDNPVKMKIMNTLIPVHQENIKSDIIYFLKNIYLLVRPDSAISENSMKSFVLGKDLPIESRLIVKWGFVDQKKIHPDSNYGAIVRLLGKSIAMNETNVQELLTKNCNYGKQIEIEALLKRGGDANLPDELQNTPFYSAYTGYAYAKSLKKNDEYDDQKLTSVTDILLKYGLNVNLPDNKANLIIAFKCSHLLPILFEHGLDPNLKITDGRSIMWEALFCENLNAVKLCINFGANVNERDQDGYTALCNVISKAIFRKQNEKLNPQAIEIIKLLLKNNADVNAQVKPGPTVLDLVNSKKPIDQELKDLLIKHGAKTKFQLWYKRHQSKIISIATSLILCLVYYFYYH